MKPNLCASALASPPGCLRLACDPHQRESERVREWAGEYEIYIADSIDPAGLIRVKTPYSIFYCVILYLIFYAHVHRRRRHCRRAAMCARKEVRLLYFSDFFLLWPYSLRWGFFLCYVCLDARAQILRRGARARIFNMRADVRVHMRIRQYKYMNRTPRVRRRRKMINSLKRGRMVSPG